MPRQLHGPGRCEALGGDHRWQSVRGCDHRHERHEGARLVQSVHTLTIEIRVKQPETIHTVSNAVLTAWLARKGRTPREMALKARLQEMVRG